MFEGCATDFMQDFMESCKEDVWGHVTLRLPSSLHSDNEHIWIVLVGVDLSGRNCIFFPRVSVMMCLVVVCNITYNIITHKFV